MGETYSEIPEYLIEWIRKQQIFWIASAPLSAQGHVNISPKGVADTFHIESPTKVWYEDLSGSGAETIAHIRENGRITVLFNAFEGPPRILRLYGIGSFHEMGTPEYEALLPIGSRQPGSRAVVVVDVYKCGTTCGYSVPYYSFIGHRTPLLDWAARKEAIDLASSAPSVGPPSSQSSPTTLSHASSQSQGGGRHDRLPRVEAGVELHPNGLLSWWKDRNAYSLDGLPALDVAFRQSPSSLGHHQPVRKAHQSALNAYPPSKQPVDENIQTPSNVRSRGVWGLMAWLRWFVLAYFLVPVSLWLAALATQLRALPSPAKARPTTTIRIHGDEIHEPPGEGKEPPVSWDERNVEKSRKSAAVGAPLGPRATCQAFHRWASALRRLPLASLLGHGISFLLGVMFMVFSREAQTLVKTTAHAAASSSHYLAFKA